MPGTGFEPARRFQRYHLKVVRLPISPPGLLKLKVYAEGWLFSQENSCSIRIPSLHIQLLTESVLGLQI